MAHKRVLIIEHEDDIREVGRIRYKELPGEQATRNIPVILLTGKERSAGHDDLGGQGVITKPFDPLNLSSDVSKVLGWPP